jgi:hypothetical protein
MLKLKLEAKSFKKLKSYFKLSDSFQNLITLIKSKNWTVCGINKMSKEMLILIHIPIHMKLVSKSSSNAEDSCYTNCPRKNHITSGAEDDRITRCPRDTYVEL